MNCGLAGAKLALCVCEMQQICHTRSLNVFTVCGGFGKDRQLRDTSSTQESADHKVYISYNAGNALDAPYIDILLLPLVCKYIHVLTHLLTRAIHLVPHNLLVV